MVITGLVWSSQISNNLHDLYDLHHGHYDARLLAIFKITPHTITFDGIASGKNLFDKF